MMIKQKACLIQQFVKTTNCGEVEGVVEDDELCRKTQPAGGLYRPVFPISIAGTAVALLGNGRRQPFTGCLDHDQGARFA